MVDVIPIQITKTAEYISMTKYSSRVAQYPLQPRPHRLRNSNQQQPTADKVLVDSWGIVGSGGLQRTHRRYDGLHFKDLHFMATHGQYNKSWLYSILGYFGWSSPNSISVGTTRGIQSILRYSLLPLVSLQVKSYHYSLASFGPCHAPTKLTLQQLGCSHCIFDITDMHALAVCVQSCYRAQR